MDREIVITRVDRYTLSCLYEKGDLCELWAQPEDETVRVGDIYIGKVKNIAANLGAAFVEIQPGVTGYYSLTGHTDHHFAGSIARDRLSASDQILVQVDGENIKTKGWKLTSDISLQGELCVCFPFGREIRVSRKIRNAEKKEALAAVLKEHAGRDLGWMIRTRAQEAQEEMLIHELKMLEAAARRLLQTCQMRPAFHRLYQGKSPAQDLVSRYLTDPSCTLRSDLEEVCQEAEESIRSLQLCGMKDALKICHYTDKSYPLAKLKGLKSQLEKALSKKVWLRGGGCLIIEQTEALTSVDVNSGKNQKGRDPGRLFFETNREAVREALRQIRLRNLSGIILIDLINMKEEEDRAAILKLAREEAARDPVPTSVIDMTRLQLLEITRKKIKKPLSQVMS